VNVTDPPTTTLAGVLVRCSAGAEDRHEESVSRGTQVVEDYYTGSVIPSTPDTPYECAKEYHTTGTGV
jgi:hypothetical protein